MKTNVFFALFTLILSTSILRSQTTWQPEGSDVIYGRPGINLVHMGVNADNPESARKQQAPRLQELYTQKVHPFEWGQHFGDELVWHISGTRQALDKELKLIKGNNRPSWVWDSAPAGGDLKLFINLSPSGQGRFQLFQNTEIIAEGQCVSSNKVTPEGQKIIENSQPLPNSYKILKKELVHINHDKLEMKWAMLIDNKRKIYLHSRILRPSHGCVGTTVPMSKFLYERLSEGDIVSIGIR